MTKLTTRKEVEYFQSLPYDKKLKYFDDNGIYFLYNTHTLGAKDFYITIKPTNTSELKQYNIWIVNHWRKLFHDDLKYSKEISNVRSFKYYNELKEHYFSVVLGGAYSDQMSFIKSEIESVGIFVTDLKIPRAIITKVYQSLQNHLEYEIYNVNDEASNPVTKLKNIAKVIDVIKYRIFLRSEQVRHSTAKLQSASFEVRPLTNEQLIEIFDYLVSNEFIDSKSSQEYFIEVFTNNVKEDKDFIKWIDKSQTNYYVNKLTLISLIDILVGPHIEGRNMFIKTYFKLYQLKRNGVGDREIVEITNDNLKQSRKISNRQNVGKEGVSMRQVKIMNKIKSIISSEI